MSPFEFKMDEISRFSDSDSLSDDFEAMDIDSDAEIQFDTENQSDAAVSWSSSHDDDMICDHFVEYFNVEYKKEFPDRCVEGTTDPWYGINCDADRIDELFHRITCYVSNSVDQRYNKDPDAERPFRFRVTKEILSGWMDVLVQRSRHELMIAGYGSGCIIIDDPLSGTYSLYKRLDDWVQMLAVEHGLSDSSISPGRGRSSGASQDGHEGDDEPAGSEVSFSTFDTNSISD